MRVLAFLDGTLANPEDPHIRVDDLSVQRGDGIFETVLVVGGEPRELRPHLDRLARSASMLDLPEPDDEAWQRTVRLVLDQWPSETECALKLVYTRGVDGTPDPTPTAFVLASPIGEKIIRARAEGVSVVTLDRGIDPGLAERAPWLLLGAKSLSYAVNMAAGREAARRGAEDVIFLATDGSVLEGPTSNVIVARGRTLYTPPATIGILPGTTQAAVFRGAERAGWTTKIEPLSVEDLHDNDGLFLASSVRKLTRVHTLDGEQLPDAGAVHAELAKAYEDVYA
ncbi:4-amino-4-deoxychorismate lyase [Amycolatopsis bartoniae]|uniref:4-amino-4-deoxychorismate lyase n=1 Tax=Amycolatopsis bartoniae TaxID=941986 RepID=A0A8H9IVA1_9PSEU|nr:aminodeoxychorismate lyase [Amycolatopsis bartoniae]MBB2933088.1 4-amino-4-deoxychorismate lyase [Amycolatopsis bartoniae]TVT11906.1 aminodeoxychorismate lyase [Amycolatopsis bartoniae]GHF56989.1 4-amino-4-deoxychorismate lyase [Amycolatopsis bartoniae]